ncbi:MAG: hypothetical protein MJ192_10370 [Clostridia bacterium]|nr:hypothetical protein [Clostridia bacterium]
MTDNQRKGLAVYEALGSAREAYIRDSVLPVEKARDKDASLWARLNTNAWVAAAAGLIVAFSVVALIIWAGRAAGPDPIAHGTHSEDSENPTEPVYFTEAETDTREPSQGDPTSAWYQGLMPDAVISADGQSVTVNGVLDVMKNQAEAWGETAMRNDPTVFTWYGTQAQTLTLSGDDVSRLSVSFKYVGGLKSFPSPRYQTEYEYRLYDSSGEYCIIGSSELEDVTDRLSLMPGTYIFGLVVTVHKPEGTTGADSVWFLYRTYIEVTERGSRLAEPEKVVMSVTQNGRTATVDAAITPVSATVRQSGGASHPIWGEGGVSMYEHTGSAVVAADSPFEFRIDGMNGGYSVGKVYLYRLSSASRNPLQPVTEGNDFTCVYDAIRGQAGTYVVCADLVRDEGPGEEASRYQFVMTLTVSNETSGSRFTVLNEVEAEFRAVVYWYLPDDVQPGDEVTVCVWDSTLKLESFIASGQYDPKTIYIETSKLDRFTFTLYDEHNVRIPYTLTDSVKERNPFGADMIKGVYTFIMPEGHVTIRIYGEYFEYGTDMVV